MTEPVDNSSETFKPWYKQFWPWFLIGMPFSAVVAGITTLFIAIDHADSLVVDDYYKEGLAINRVLEEDEIARQLHIKAQLEVDLLLGDVHVSLSGMLENPPETLELSWIHPIRKNQDFSMTVRRVSGSDYMGQLPHSVDGRWYLQLRGEVPHPWRLRSEISPGDRTSVRF